MILQHVIAPEMAPTGSERLYSSSACHKFPATLHDDEELDFLGFFNYFSLSQWYAHTDIRDVSLTLTGKGCGTVTLLRFSENQRTDCLEKEVRLDDRPSICVPWDSGLVGFSIRSRGESTVCSACYCTDMTPKRGVRLGICICTYKREEWVNRNIRAFRAALDRFHELSGHTELFVIDNGSTLDTEDLSYDWVHVIPNENTGGSGGFSKGIVEVSERGFTHVALMDDDTVVEPEAFFRSWAYLSYLNDSETDTILGGIKLSLTDPHIVLESSSTFDNGTLHPNHQGMNVSGLEGCLDITTTKPANYNGWWYCVFPTSFANPHNLPLKLFMQMDDVEYGFRSHMPVLILNGISVWHMDSRERYSGTLDYYAVRNLLLVCQQVGCLNQNIWVGIIKRIVSEILCLRYRTAEMMILGIEHFGKGYDWVSSQNSDLNDRLYKMSYRPLMLHSKPDIIRCPLNHPKTLLRYLSLNGLFFKEKVRLPVTTTDSSELFGVKEVDYISADEEAFTEKRNLITASSLLLRMLITILRTE